MALGYPVAVVRHNHGSDARRDLQLDRCRSDLRRRRGQRRLGLRLRVAARTSRLRIPKVLTVTAITDSNGNGGAPGSPPACDPSQSDEIPADFSNFATTAAGAAHTIAAPGVCIRFDVEGDRLQHDLRNEHGLAARRGRRCALSPGGRPPARPLHGEDSAAEHHVPAEHVGELQRREPVTRVHV